MPIPTHKGLPIPAGEVTYWGLPYHGLVRAGQMELPNGTTRANAQPSGGSTVVVKNPRKADLPATRPLASYDAAQGFTWLTFAILAGSQKQIAGVDLGGQVFIFVDHRDRPWLITVAQLIGGDWQVKVLRRFGLFGEDSVSWIENRVIYQGDFGHSTLTSYTILDSNDLCQNYDGSSVLLNFRASYGTAGTLWGLRALINLQITTADAYPGSPADVVFTVNAPDLFPDGLTITDSGSVGEQPAGEACGLMECTGANWSQDSLPPAYCGPGNVRPGTYVTDGSVDTASAWTSTAYTKHSWDRQTDIVKAYYGHDGELKVVSLQVNQTSDIDYQDYCSATFSASIYETLTVAESGETNGSGLPCSALGVYQTDVTMTGGKSGGYLQVNTLTRQGGIFINDIPQIEWNYQMVATLTGWSNLDSSYSYTNSWTEGNTPIFPAEYWNVRNWCQSWFVGKTITMNYGTEDSGTNQSYDYTSDIDGVSWPEHPNFSMGNQYIRPYANNAFSLVLISLNHPEGDPQAPEYFAQYGVVAEEQRPVYGVIADKTFYVSVNPVDGAVTVDQNYQVCYA